MKTRTQVINEIIRILHSLVSELCQCDEETPERLAKIQYDLLQLTIDQQDTNK